MGFLILPLLTLGGLGAVFGLMLGFFQKVFYVEVDPRVEEIKEALPGANCGGCGYAGCAAYAEALVAGNAPSTACSAGGNAVAKQIAGILGVEAGEVVKRVAFVKCGGSCTKSKEKYEYSGILDCTAASMLAGGGSKNCRFGCVGLGSCEKACSFGAIRRVNGLAIVDPDKCGACGACVTACPKALIELIPYKSGAKVLCNSSDKGKDVKENCSVGCIGCRLCAKECQFGAIEVENNLARINYEKCTNCGKCVAKCPTTAIGFSLRRKHLNDD